MRFIVTAGQVVDITQAPALLDGQEGQAVLADKAYDSNALRATIQGQILRAYRSDRRYRSDIHKHLAASQAIRVAFSRYNNYERAPTASAPPDGSP
ncbi:transposase [Sinorhizobium sp. 8-89]|uniref:transposase n=1 Tax=Sinorhizobium sp. 8-89 TaxID=3049089 RepID=UPI00386CD736